MHFNIYVDDHLASQLSSFAKKQGITRNSLIREALQNFINEHQKKWPDQILQFQGVKDFPAFEQHRKDLLLKDEDPFS